MSNMLYEIPVLIAGAAISASLLLPELQAVVPVMSWGLAAKMLFTAWVVYGLGLACWFSTLIRHRVIFAGLWALNGYSLVALALKLAGIGW
ncbi:hypothetical protein VITFI_CDS0381 [Vitreoscilla filiformis]|uniref:Uncharacterized protein n=2 Tax=Vitreoscilla filiformis TaxID=63 RepID=A0A221KBF2_VITFI|nr:hypothetical protein VITFI_CDS0381 [Vitreoscilla filiformis]